MCYFMYSNFKFSLASASSTLKAMSNATIFLLQIVNDDIEVIEETIPKLKAFYSSYNEISSEVDDLLKKMETFSVSAISSDGLESKNKQLQELEEAVNQRRSKLEALLASCDLLETPFDQSQFEKNVSELQEKMAQCDQVTFIKKMIKPGLYISTLFPSISGCCREEDRPKGTRKEGSSNGGPVPAI